MNLLDSIKSAISSLMANKGRLILGVISISIGVSTLFAAMVLSETLKASLKREIEKIGVNLIDVSVGQPEQRLTEKDVNMIRGCSKVLRVATWSGAFLFSVQYFNKSLEKILIVDWTPEIKEMSNLSLKYGRFFTQQEVESRCNVGVIGKDVASKLFGKTSPVGKDIIIMFQGNKFPIRIVGVLDELGALQTVMTLIRNEGIVLPYPYIREKVLLQGGYDCVRSILVQSKANVEVKEVMRQIKREFALRNTPCSFFTLDEIIEYKNKFLKRVALIGLCITMVFLIVGGIGITNIMLKSVIARTKEIGIRKAVGAKNRDILIQFLLEAFIIGILGCIVGIVIGIVICIVGVHFIPEELVKPENIVISLEAIFVSCGVALGISLLSGLYPAHKASSLPPIDALRYE